VETAGGGEYSRRRPAIRMPRLLSTPAAAAVVGVGKKSDSSSRNSGADGDELGAGNG